MTNHITKQHACLFAWCTGKGTTALLEHFCQEGMRGSNHEDTTGQPLLSGILQNNCPTLFKTGKIAKDNERSRNWRRLRETKVAWHHDPRLDPGPEKIKAKGQNGSAGEMWLRSIDQIIPYQCELPDLIVVCGYAWEDSCLVGSLHWSI